MKPFTKQIIGHITAISAGGLAGFSIVKFYLTPHILWLFLMSPCIIFVVRNFYKIHTLTKNIKEIEKNFKDKYGFDIRDKDAFNKYLDEIGKEEK